MVINDDSKYFFIVYLNILLNSVDTDMAALSGPSLAVNKALILHIAKVRKSAPRAGILQLAECS